MHICMLCNFFYPTALFGGIERHVYNLSKGLSEAGFEVSIITSDLFTYSGRKYFAQSESQNEEVIIQRLHTYADLMNNPITPSLLFKLFQNGFDMIHCHDHYYFGSLISACATRIQKKPLVLTIHTSKIEYRQIFPSLIRSIYDLSFSKYVLNTCDRIIVLSEALRKKVLGDNVPLSKIRCIPNGIDFDEFSTNTFTTSKRSGKSNVLLFVGRLVERKGLHVLLEAIKLISNQLNCKLVIIGDGPQRNELEKLSKALEIDSIVSFLGHVSQKELIEAYQSSDIFVLPSISGEVQPFVLLEAIAFQKPFIATKVGGIPDLERQGLFGYFVEPNNPIAIADAMLDFSQTKTNNFMWKSNINRRTAKQKFSTERMVKDTIKVYEELM